MILLIFSISNNKLLFTEEKRNELSSKLPFFKNKIISIVCIGIFLSLIIMRICENILPEFGI